MARILRIVILLLLSSYSYGQNKNLYSTEFYEHFKNSEIELQADSLVFPIDNQIEPIKIPSELILNKEYIFLDKTSGLELKAKRTNYTDIDFSIKFKKQLTIGNASISPSFYLGAESIETSEGGFWITQYSVKESTTDCLYIIGIGNQNIADETPSDLYAYIYFKTDCKTDDVQKTDKLLWMKK